MIANGIEASLDVLGTLVKSGFLCQGNCISIGETPASRSKFGTCDPLSYFGLQSMAAHIVGECSMEFQKNPMITQDLSSRCISTRGGECVHVPL